MSESAGLRERLRKALALEGRQGGGQRWHSDVLINLVLVISAGAVAFFVFTSSYQHLILATVLVNIILALSLAMVTVTGRISIAQASLAGVGAYVSGYLALNSGVNPVVALVIGALATMIVGAAIGVLAFRLEGFYFAVATIAFSQIFIVVVSGWTSVTGGLSGLNGIPPLPNLSLLGLNITYGFDITFNGYYGTLLVLMGISLIIVYTFTGNTKIGRRVRAVGDDEVLSESIGVSTTFWRAVAFAVGSMLAGLAGGLQASFLAGAAPSSYDTFTSVTILAMVFTGGRRSVLGGVVGAVLLTVVPEALRFSGGQSELIFYGSLFIIVAFFFPEGIIPTSAQFFRSIRTRLMRPQETGESDSKVDYER